jgi:hypothetical protein
MHNKNTPSCCSARRALSLLGDHAIVTGEHHVLVAASQPGALEVQSLAQPPLHPVSHLDACPAPGARPLPRDGTQKLHPVRGHRVGEERHRVEPLVSARRGAVERRHLSVQRHGLHVVRELREQRAEAQEVRLAAGGSLGADREVALRQQPGHGLGVPRAVARQPHRLDGRDQLGQAAEAVRQGRHGLLQRRGEHDGVDKRPVRAHVEDAPPPLAVCRRGAEAGGAEADAEDRGSREVDLVRENDTDVNADDGEDDAERKEEEEGEHGGGCGEEGEAPVVEDERLWVFLPRELVVLCALSAHDVKFLPETQSIVLVSEYMSNR